MSDKRYTETAISANKGSLRTIKNFLKDKEFNLCIEIGVFEGATSNLIADHLTDNGKLICIDPLLDTYIVNDISPKAKIHNDTRWKYFEGQYDRFMHNTKENLSRNKIELIRKTSDDAFKDLKTLRDVDFCYIDGDHRTEAVFRDGENCLTACRTGGFMLFDDYGWMSGDKEFDCGKGIELFIDKHRSHIDVIFKTGQVLVKKK